MGVALGAAVVTVHEESPQAAISKKHPSPGFLEAQLLLFALALWCIYLWNNNKNHVLGNCFFPKGCLFWIMKIMMMCPFRDLFESVEAWSWCKPPSWQTFFCNKKVIRWSGDQVVLKMKLRRHVGNYKRNTTNMEVEMWLCLNGTVFWCVGASNRCNTQCPPENNFRLRQKNPNYLVVTHKLKPFCYTCMNLYDMFIYVYPAYKQGIWWHFLICFWYICIYIYTHFIDEIICGLPANGFCQALRAASVPKSWESQIGKLELLVLPVEVIQT